MDAQAFGEDRQGTARYLTALREHWLLVALVVAVAVGAAVAYVVTAQKRYEAETDVLVTPIPSNDSAFVGFSLLREGNDPTRAVLTAARLVRTPAVAGAVARRLGLASPGAAFGHVSVTPIGQSSIVAITGKWSTPERAAELADAFANRMIASRTAIFQSELESRIARLRAQLASVPAAQRGTSPIAGAIATQLGTLVSLVGSQDPTLRVLTPAAIPASPSWPRPVLTTGVAFLASLLLGAAFALALELIGPRVNREEELLFGQRLPILARVPRMPGRTVRRYLTGRDPLPASVREAYRTLRASLGSAGQLGTFPQTILVTSAMPGEGKTMTSVNLATTLALSGQRVILVDGDLRRPMIATVFGVASRPNGLGNLLAGDAEPEDALVSAPGHGDGLRLLLASPDHVHLVDLMESSRVERVLAQLRLLADVIIVDSPPLTEVSDALTLADEMEAVIVAVRLGRTRRERLSELRRMLAQRGVSPVGFVVTLRRRTRGTAYGYGTEAPERPPAPAGAVADGGAARRFDV